VVARDRTGSCALGALGVAVSSFGDAENAWMRNGVAQAQLLFGPYAFYVQSLYNRATQFVKGANRMSIRSTVASQFEQVALEQKRKLARLSDDLRLLDSGLDSLSFALIVARLEDSLGVDPFDTADEVSFPVTFGDFVRLYERHPG
jgi:hypothetical protein